MPLLIGGTDDAQAFLCVDNVGRAQCSGGILFLLGSVYVGHTMIRWLLSFFNRTPVKLAIVRRYVDANGSFVGELYLYDTVQRKHDAITGYQMIGASLDTLPLNLGAESTTVFALDTGNDFLAPMPPMTVRVGSLYPEENDNVRQMVRRLPRRNMTLIIQNRFIEHVLDSKETH